jgi:hypothetical protein
MTFLAGDLLHVKHLRHAGTPNAKPFWRENSRCASLLAKILAVKPRPQPNLVTISFQSKFVITTIGVVNLLNAVEWK